MLICTPIQAKTQKEAIRKMRFLKGKTDLAELWLDSIRDLDLPALLRAKPLPVICKGKRALKAGRLGADYIDIPVSFREAKRRGIFRVTRNEEILRFAQNDTGCKLILSHHDFKRTPSFERLFDLAITMRRDGADIVKIAVTALKLEDTLSIIMLAQTLHEKKIPHILIAMGPLGRLSRVITPHLGGTLMFAPLTAAAATAPGQLTVRQLKAAWNLIR